MPSTNAWHFYFFPGIFTFFLKRFALSIERRGMKALLTSVISWGIASLSLSAQTWPRETLATGPETGSLMATAVDQHGRIHTVHTQATGIALDETTLVYRVTDVAFNQTQPAGATFGFFSSTSTPTDLSITVDNNFGVKVATIDKKGEVNVAELSNQFDTTWEFTLVSVLGSQHLTETGISIAAGTGDQRGSALVYTRRGSTLTEAGAARFHVQNLDGTWSAGVDLFGGNGSGIAPTLLHTPQGLQGNRFIIRTVVAYDATNDRLHFTNGTDFNSLWSSTNIIAESIAFTKPDATYRDGRLAVAWSDSGQGVSYATRQQRSGTTGTLFTHYDWISEKAVPATEIAANEFFGNKVALALDAGGHPQIAFTRNLNLDINGRSTRDVQVWRKFGPLGWSQAHRQDFPSTPLGIDNLTTGLDLATHVNGDPVLVYERDRGTASDAIIARPLGAPWIVEKAPLLEDYGNSFAPALASGPNGDLHLIASGSSDAIIPSYFNSKLITINSAGSSDVFIPSPSSGLITVANTLTITPDGIAHVVGIRVDTLSAMTGEIFYWSGPPSGPITLQPGPTVNIATLGAGGKQTGLVLKSDSAGNLLLVFATDEGLEILGRPKNGTWSDRRRLGGNLRGIDCDLRSDGGFVLSYFSVDLRHVGLATNINTNTGALVDFRAHIAFSLGSGDQEPFDTACSLGPDGRPRIAFTQGGIMNFLSPNATGSPLFSRSEVGINANDSTVETVVESDRYHLLAHSTTNVGTLKHLVVKDSGKIKESVVASPGRILSNFRQRQGISAALDANGYPVMAVGLIDVGFNPGSTIMLARPGDSLDADGDGLPLLLENAHCYNANSADGPHSLVSGESTVSATFIQQIFEYRRPNGFGANTVQGRRYADLNFDLETSLDLKNWEFETFVSGENSPLLNANVGTDEGEGCLRSRSGFLYLRGSAAFEEKRFGRLRISRAR
ncbi:MAG: hypothetical protein ACJAVK_000804 [Akkermansiaceae bacterium]|jgi:hypothetical protein